MAKMGTIGWCDLTVAGAEQVRDFYANVIGWTPQECEMGGYSDYNMCSDGEPVAGVCHSRGANTGIPPVWMIYFTVANLDQSIAACEGGGGKVIFGPKEMGPGARFCIIEDPAGAAAGLYQPAGPVAAD
jgi:predicted enzyme related to lactoylglutathione lyase